MGLFKKDSFKLKDYLSVDEYVPLALAMAHLADATGDQRVARVAVKAVDQSLSRDELLLVVQVVNAMIAHGIEDINPGETEKLKKIEQWVKVKEKLEKLL